jgi:NADP-dependent 3-hydroxy acid dehydrogenase YdfG
MTNKQSNRVWLITGCSSGFGRDLAICALEQGDSVIATARNTKQIQDLVDDYPNTAKAVHLDVTDKTSVEAAIKTGLAAFGKIDVLVNNVGNGVTGAVEEVTEQQARNQFDTNFFGLLTVTKAVLPIMRQQKSGHILNFSSVLGRLSLPGIGIYGASKFAVEGASEALAQEVKPFGIKVTIIEPGAFSTSFMSKASGATTMSIYDTMREEQAKTMSDMAFGNPKVGMQAVMKIVDLKEPPLRFTIGPATMPWLISKLNEDIEEYQLHEKIWQSSTST